MAVNTPIKTNTNGAAAITPEQIGALVEAPVREASVAFNDLVSTAVTTDSHDYRIPILLEDPEVSWVDEGEEISPGDVEFDELKVTPKKAAGLVGITSELADDSSPDAQSQVGRSLAEKLVAKVDYAFLNKQTAPAAPKGGLGNLVGTTDLVTDLSNLDFVADAISAIELAGGNLTALIANPADALVLAKLKESAGSNKPLLGDASEGLRARALGMPVLTSRHCPKGTIYGVSRGDVQTILRKGTTLVVDRSVWFTRDLVAIRSIMRVEFGVPVPARVAVITVQAADGS